MNDLPKGLYRRGGVIWTKYWGPRLDGTRGPVRESCGTDDVKKAIAYREKRLREIANAKDRIKRFIGPDADRMKVATLLDGLVTRHRVEKRKGLRQTIHHLKPLRRLLGARKACEITAQSVLGYIDARRKDAIGDTTVQRELELLRRAFNIFTDDRGEPIFRLRVPRLVRVHANARKGFADYPDFLAIVENVDDAGFRDWLEWFNWTEMRPGEIDSLAWADLQDGVIVLSAEASKTGEARSIPICGPLVPIIDRRKAARRLDTDRIFHWGDGKRFTDEAKGGGLPRPLYRKWYRACRKIGLPVAEWYLAECEHRRVDPERKGKRANLVPYDLRRSGSKNMRAAGVPERVIMEIAGWKTRSMFDRYGIVDERDKRKAFDAVAEYVSGLPTESKVRAFENGHRKGHSA